MDGFDWVDKQEEKRKESRSKEYFDIVEGRQQFILLSHCAPYAQVYEAGKYRAAVEGDAERNISIRGVCWVYQDDVIKSAKLPYVVVKAIRALAEDPEWDFDVPFPHMLTLNAEGAGTKEVKYSLTPSPKKVEIPKAVLAELAKKPKPEEMVEKFKGKKSETSDNTEDDTVDYPSEDINPDDIPF